MKSYRKYTYAFKQYDIKYNKIITYLPEVFCRKGLPPPLAKAVWSKCFYIVLLDIIQHKVDGTKTYRSSYFYLIKILYPPLISSTYDNDAVVLWIFGPGISRDDSISVVAWWGVLSDYKRCCISFWSSSSCCISHAVSVPQWLV